MKDAALTQPEANVGMAALLGLGGSVPAGFASDPARAPQAEDDVSVAGVMLLSAMSVLMAILAMVGFALVVIAVWWAISHVPIPAALHHFFGRLNIFR